MTVPPDGPDRAPTALPAPMPAAEAFRPPSANRPPVATTGTTGTAATGRASPVRYRTSLSKIPRLPGLLLVALACAVLAAAGWGVRAPDATAPVLWLPTGIALVALLAWPRAAVPAVLTGSTLGLAVAGMAPAPAIVTGAVATLAGGLGAWLLRRARFDATLVRRRDLGLFMVLGVGAPALLLALAAAILAGGARALGLPMTWADVGGAMLGWCAATGVGTLVVAVPWLALLAAGSGGRTAPGPSPGTALVGAGTLATCAVLSWPAVPPPAALPFALLLPLPVAWMALRSGLASSAGLAALLSLVLTAGTVAGVGPFTALPAPQALWLAWQSATILMVVAMLLAAQASEQQAALAQWRLALAAGRMGTWAVEPASGQTTWDATTRELLGVPEHVPPGEAAFIAAVHPDDRAAVLAGVARAVQTGSDLDLEYRLKPDPQGATRWLSSRARPMRNAEGAFRLVGVHLDVTARHEREGALAAARAASEASTAKSEFLSRMSHELRTPLNAVLGFAQLLSLDARRPLDAAQRGHVAQILKAGEHLLEMINEVLDLSMIETGRLALRPTAVRLADVAIEAVGLVSTQAAAAAVEVDDPALAIDPSLAVLADPGRLRQALVNLLVNGIKYNRAGGHVTIDAQASGDRVQLSVADTGLGMSAAQRAQLFEPFNRLGRERSTVPGTGIGLLLTRRLIEAMGGTIAVDSTPGVGTRFTLALQRAPAAAVAPTAPIDLATPAPGGRPAADAAWHADGMAADR